MNKKEFLEELKKINIFINEYQLNQLERYYELLVEWNKKINLTSIIKKEEVYLKHFYDSLTISKIPSEYINLTKKLSVCDVGTGAGFPGIVLKIVFPNLKITLLDSLNKRIIFLNEVIKELNLNDIVAVHDRAELFSINNREKFDLVVSRAVANLRFLSELCIPMLKINGYLVCLKGNFLQEKIESKNALSILKSDIILVDNFLLPKEKSVRNLVLIQKKFKTDKKYPRKFDKIKKNPL